jgi:formamidopyrimidine-DNA glycosylase
MNSSDESKKTDAIAPGCRTRRLPPYVVLPDMPELPEMTAYCHKVDDAFTGATLIKSDFTATAKTDVPAEEIQSAIDGSRLTEVDRNGKELFLHFDSGDVLAVHLMLAGRFNVESVGEPPPAGRIASFEFDNGKLLHVRDRDGWAKLKFNPEPVTAPDALSPEMNEAYLKQRFAKSPRANVKAFLTDQKRIRGIGNAYSDEILWASRIAPQSRCGKLPEEAVAALAIAIREVLTEAVGLVGALADPSDYRKARLQDLKVHNHTRDKSPTGAPIKTGKVANSKTYFTDEQILYA